MVGLKKPVTAVEVKTTLFDVFGQNMRNLGNREIADYAPGKHELSGGWRASYDWDEYQILTTVKYVSRVRLADDSQWTFEVA